MNKYEKWIKSCSLNLLLVVMCAWIPMIIGQIIDGILLCVYGVGYATMYVIGYVSVGMIAMLIGIIIVCGFVIVGFGYLPETK